MQVGYFELSDIDIRSIISGNGPLRAVAGNPRDLLCGPPSMSGKNEIAGNLL